MEGRGRAWGGSKLAEPQVASGRTRLRRDPTFPHPVTGQQGLSGKQSSFMGSLLPSLPCSLWEVVLPTDFKGLLSLLLLPASQGGVLRSVVRPLPGVTGSLKGIFDFLVASGTLWRTVPVQSLLSASYRGQRAGTLRALGDWPRMAWGRHPDPFSRQPLACAFQSISHLLCSFPRRAACEW